MPTHPLFPICRTPFPAYVRNEFSVFVFFLPLAKELRALGEGEGGAHAARGVPARALLQCRALFGLIDAPLPAAAAAEGGGGGGGDDDEGEQVMVEEEEQGEGPGRGQPGRGGRRGKGRGNTWTHAIAQHQHNLQMHD